MKELRRLTGEAVAFPTLEAEDLAATYLDQPAAQQRVLIEQLRLLTAGVAVLPALGMVDERAVSPESQRPSVDEALFGPADCRTFGSSARRTARWWPWCERRACWRG